MAYQTNYFSPDGIPDDEPISMCMMSDSDFEIEEEDQDEEREPLWRSDEDYGKER